MAAFDLVVRGGRVVTASAEMEADVGILHGRIACLGRDLGAGKDEIDARGLLVLPGGIDSHTHIDQWGPPGIEPGDSFETGTRAALCGGNTTVLSFALQSRGTSLRATVDAYHALAQGNCHLDYGFHLIVTEPSEHLLGQELPALIHDGCSSVKLFMT